MTPRISIIVPCYNEEHTIASVVERTLSAGLGWDCEIIVVDDGLADGTKGKVQFLDKITLVRHDINLGKGAAISTGVQKVTGSAIIVQDADLEYDPADIPRFAKPQLDETSDIVYGSRFKGKICGMSFSHYVGNRILAYFTNLLYGAHLTDVMTGHKDFRKEIFEKLDLNCNGFEFVLEAINALENHYRIAEVPIDYTARQFGNAKIRWFDGASCLVHLLRHRLMQSERKRGLRVSG